MKNILGLLSVLLIIACESDPKEKSLDHIAKIYDAKVSYSESTSTSEGLGTELIFNIEASDSKLLDSLRPVATTANIALLFYEHLTEKERDEFDIIDVKLISSKDALTAYFYPIDIIDNISARSRNFKFFSDKLISRDFKAIDEIRNENDFKDPISDILKDRIETHEKELGKLIAYQPIGIEEKHRLNGDSALQFQGFLIFENGRKTYYVYIEDKVDDAKIIGLKIF